MHVLTGNYHVYFMAGLTAPSRGTVYVNGKDLSKNLDEVRSDLGVCPQENTMFPDLTVLEQLRLIGLVIRLIYFLVLLI